MPAVQLLSGSAQTTDVAPVSKAETRLMKPQGMQAAFSNYMQQSSFNGAQMAKQQTVASTIGTAKPQNNAGNVQQDYAQYQSKTAVQAERVAGKGGMAQGADAEVSAEVVEAVEDAVEAIKDIIKEELGVDDKQLEDAMELLGMTQLDLLDPQQLTALAVELTGSEDAGRMLFSEGFQAVMQQVAEVTQDVLQNLGMTSEQLMDQISRMVQTAQPVQTVQPEVADVQATVEAVPHAAEVLEAGVSQVQQEGPVQDVQATEAEIPVEVVQQTEVPRESSRQVQEAAAEVQPQVRQAEETQVQEQPQEVQEQPKGQVVQEGQPVQEQQDTQEGQEETDLEQNADPQERSRNMQQDSNPRFEFHTEAPQGQRMDTPVVNNPVNQVPLPQVNVESVIRQISEYTRLHLTESVKTIEMQLNPANLGKIFLHVTQKAGAVTAQITAQNENVKEALIQQAAILKDNLNQQGIKVNAVEVSAGTHEFESNLEKDARQQEEQARQQEEQSNRRSRRGINLNDLDDLDGLSGLMTEEEALVAQIMRDNGNNVDFKA